MNFAFELILKIFISAVIVCCEFQPLDRACKFSIECHVDVRIIITIRSSTADVWELYFKHISSTGIQKPHPPRFLFQIVKLIALMLNMFRLVKAGSIYLTMAYFL